jgi:cobalamin biosynthesis Mg chelatase CobN
LRKFHYGYEEFNCVRHESVNFVFASDKNKFAVKYICGHGTYMGQCQMEDGTIVPDVANRQHCWQRGGAKWNNGVFNSGNPNQVRTASDAAKAVEDAKTAQTTAVVATAIAANAEVAATAAKEVRDKCIVDANTAHQAAMKACGAKEGFGELDMSSCGLWLLLLVIVLVFVALCMQGGDKKEGVFEINEALL